MKGFDSEKYIEEQSRYIKERILSSEGERLYLEFGGKLVHDRHAMRVLPGFDENAKIKVLSKLKDQAEIIICVYSGDIATNKTRADFGITYDLEVLRLIDTFRKNDLSINSVVITRYEDHPAVNVFIKRLKRRMINTYTHYYTKGYPTDIDTIVSDEGYGANEYISVTKPIVIVNGPGPGSGKLATCLSQLYHEYKRGNKANYAKYETFPIWNLPLKHPVNLAYESATVDLKDFNVIDSFYLESTGKTAVNYNRDMEAFPLVKRIIEKITGLPSKYNSPTDMGVNRAGFSIIDDEVCRDAASQEIIRRYLISLCDYKKGYIDQDSVAKSKLLLDELSLRVEDRKVLAYTMNFKIPENSSIMALELKNGKIITGKSSKTMVSAAACILNAIKVLSNIDDEIHLISPDVLSAIQHLKTDILGHEKASLNCEEILTALTISASINHSAKVALEKLLLLKECQAHCTAILSDRDSKTLKALGIDATSDPEYQSDNLYYF